MAKRGDRNAFFYGTLMAPEILQQVLSRYSPQKKVRERLTIRPAILHNYCRHRVLNADYPGMIEQQGASVRGTLVEGLTGMDVQKLDAFEGDEYERICVGVMVLEHANRTEGDGKELVEGDQVEADTYVFIGGEDLLEKKEWDYEEFRREKLSNWAATSEEYADVDAFDAVVNNGEHDPTGGRAYFKADLWDEDWIDTNEAPGKENTEKKADVDAGYSGVDGMDRHHRPTRLSELLDEDEKKDLEEELESAV